MHVDMMRGVYDMEIKELRKALNMTQTEFSKEYNIPQRTIQSWELGVRKPPDYVLELLERVVEYDLKEGPSKRLNRLKAYSKGMEKILKKQGK